jgi:hypothetical protein
MKCFFKFLHYELVGKKVSQENLQNETKLRRFLLGEMPENERVEFEEQFLLDEELFENIRVAEDELIESYLRGTLEASEKTNFEKHYLSNPKRRERVEFTRQMLEKFAAAKKTERVVETVSFWEKIAAFFRQPQFALGSAVAILLLLLGGWLLFRNVGKPVDIVTVTPTPTPTSSATPTPTTTETPKVDSNVNLPNKSNGENLNQRPSNVNKPLPNVEPTPKKEDIERPVITTLALFTGGVRSDGKTNELNLPRNSGGANLQLNLESQDYKLYRAEIVDQNGQIIYRSGRLVPNKSKVNVLVSPQKLKRGDYIIKLYGKNTQNEDESVADFQFRVNQK